MAFFLPLLGANLLLAGMKANQQAKQRQQEANMRAAEIEASPWTGRGPSTQVSTTSPNMWAEMAGGGINALGQAGALEKSGLFSSSETPDTSNLAMQGPQTLPEAQMSELNNFKMNEKSPWTLFGKQKTIG
jgi:hypothetical protein